MVIDFIMVYDGVDFFEVNKIFVVFKKGKFLIVDFDGNFVLMIFCFDLIKNFYFFFVFKVVDFKQFICVVVIGICFEDKVCFVGFVEVGFDIVILDLFQGNLMYQIEMIKWIKNEYFDFEVIGGNVVICEQVVVFIVVGVDGFCIGMGFGFVCIIQEVMVVGCFQVIFVYNVVVFVVRFGVFCIVDGGVQNVGYIVKGIVFGVFIVMMGGFFVGIIEFFGIFFVFCEGKFVKVYCGMGFIDVMQDKKVGGGGKDSQKSNVGIVCYFFEGDFVFVVQGVFGVVVYCGFVSKFVFYFVVGFKYFFQDMGMISVEEFYKQVEVGIVCFEICIFSVQFEGGVNMEFYEKKFYV